jgi:hypothetical protein
LSRARRVEFEFAIKQRFAGKMTEHHVRVSYRRQKRSAITRRARIRAGGFRTDAQRSAFVDSCNRSPARADGVNVHHRNRDGHSGDNRFIRQSHPFAIAQRDVSRSSAHVEGDDVRETRSGGDAQGTHDTAGRARQNGAHGFVRSCLSRDASTRRLHDAKLGCAGVPPALHAGGVRTQTREISTHQRLQIRVDTNSGRAFVLAILRQNLMRN